VIDGSASAWQSGAVIAPIRQAEVNQREVAMYYEAARDAKTEKHIAALIDK
jgi:hypothetical protein